MASYIDTMMVSTVFGVELEYLLQREAANGEVRSGAIPSVLEQLIHEVEIRGLTEVGICTRFLPQGVTNASC